MGQFDGVARVVVPVQVHAEIAVRSKRFADGFHALHDAAQVLVSEALGVQVVARLEVLGIGLPGDAVALKFESRPAPFFGLGFVHFGAPGGGIVNIAHHLHGAIEAHLVAEASAE